MIGVKDEVYIGTDWDYPFALTLIGLNPTRRRGERCRHSATDGTVDCKDCGKTASKFIEQAQEILFSHAE